MLAHVVTSLLALQLPAGPVDRRVALGGLAAIPFALVPFGAQAEYRTGAAERYLEQKKLRAAAGAAETDAATASRSKKTASSQPPRTFADLLAQSKKQREDAMGMSMSESEVAALETKLRASYPGIN